MKRAGGAIPQPLAHDPSYQPSINASRSALTTSACVVGKFGDTILILLSTAIRVTPQKVIRTDVGTELLFPA